VSLILLTDDATAPTQIVPPDCDGYCVTIQPANTLDGAVAEFYLSDNLADFVQNINSFIQAENGGGVPVPPGFTFGIGTAAISAIVIPNVKTGLWMIALLTSPDYGPDKAAVNVFMSSNCNYSRRGGGGVNAGGNVI
jgi:hypothetical protein